MRVVAAKQLPDQDLVREVKGGQDWAFDLLVRRYEQRIGKLIGRYISDPHEVLDISQEAFLKAYRALGEFRGESAFYTWLYRIAVNTAKNHLVAQSRRPPAQDIDSYDAEQYGRLREFSTPEHLAMRDEIEARIIYAVEALPEELRQAILLREIEGYSYEEIAKIMSCPVGTVRSRIFRARESIDQHIKPLLLQ
ncbi:RNA polymerase sigma factor RpoE [Piscirickettsia litoralis]|uniref:RNA polymerase sigma factor RpoE n=1 Tax=Piscirickettsia litoralis TaxID=1891921 RepID=A0ABX3A0T1_9GAMM|nr:RNA polymerase sigma factor RpoE [Piscirickettsia litoralis]ODN42234.1 RNA polymerase sigma factor RpoE [Piscirickettsia litoralis]